MDTWFKASDFPYGWCVFEYMVTLQFSGVYGSNVFSLSLKHKNQLYFILRNVSSDSSENSSAVLPL